MKPIVSIIMGSTSDMPVMGKAAQLLDEFEIPGISTRFKIVASGTGDTDLCTAEGSILATDKNCRLNGCADGGILQELFADFCDSLDLNEGCNGISFAVCYLGDEVFHEVAL